MHIPQRDDPRKHLTFDRGRADVDVALAQLSITHANDPDRPSLGDLIATHARHTPAGGPSLATLAGL